MERRKATISPLFHGGEPLAWGPMGHQLQLLSADDAEPAEVQHTKPCSDCPWARKALPGWLGSHSADEWLAAAHGEARIDCHTLLGAQCAGGAIYRANMAKRPRDGSLLVLTADRERVFASPAEFTAHHASKIPAPAPTPARHPDHPLVLPGTALPLTPHCVLSDDRRYRYRLGYAWGPGRKVGFYMLNPSTATHEVLDRTMETCLRFAARWGYEGVEVANLFAFRSPDPKDLKKVVDPIGPDNDRHTDAFLEDIDLLILAWGNHGKLYGRAATVLDRLRAKGFPLLCLKISKEGQPEHPLYKKATLLPIPFVGGARP